MVTTFVVYGDPVGKARPRMTRTGHVYTPSKTRLYEEHIRDAWRAKNVPTLPTGQPVRVSIDAFFSVPKSVSKKRRATMENAPYLHKPDIDNVVKIIADGLNGLAWEDDKQITEIRASKEYSAMPRVEVEIWQG
jgi:Holliday junction resolvase RusA-like endonuclease